MRSFVHWDPLLPSFLDFYALRLRTIRFFIRLRPNIGLTDGRPGWLDLTYTSIIRYKLQLYHCMAAETPWVNWAPVPTGADWTGDCHELHWLHSEHETLSVPVPYYSTYTSWCWQGHGRGILQNPVWRIMADTNFNGSLAPWVNMPAPSVRRLGFQVNLVVVNLRF